MYVCNHFIETLKPVILLFLSNFKILLFHANYAALTVVATIFFNFQLKLRDGPHSH